MTLDIEPRTAQSATGTEENPYRARSPDGVVINPTELTVIEEDTTGESYTLHLREEPKGTVTVTVSSSSTAVTASPSSLEFTAATWNTAQTVTVTATGDQNTQDEEVTLAHSASGAGYFGDYSAVSIDSVTVTVQDNDSPGVSVRPSRLEVTEEDTTGSGYRVVLTSQPSATVTVAVSSSSTTVTASPSSLQFTTGNWARRRP